jgi:magnesium chelatase family protein
MLARRMPGILPPLSLEEAIEVTRVHSAAGLLLRAGRPCGLISRRPFRSPHHSISPAGLVGGGRPVGPGELSLAHLGVLFLDELPEFRRDVLESLRQPLEDGRLSLVRAGGAAELPSRVTLIAAMNPCHCGHLGSRIRSCICADGAIARYRSRLSGPLLDRLDLRVDVPSVTFEELSSHAPGESSASVRSRVCAAREAQLARQGSANARVEPARLRASLRLTRPAKALLERAVDRFGLSARAHDRALRVALTIKDLGDVARGSACLSWPVELGEAEVGEALSYRQVDHAAPSLSVMQGAPNDRLRAGRA